jgi:serine/threonine-protein kinase
MISVSGPGHPREARRTAMVAQELAAGGGVTDVLIANHPALAQYTPDAWTQALRSVIEQLAPTHVLLPHTYQTRDFVPMLAARLRKPAPSLTGRAVGHFQVHERIGGGGMGVVYRATDMREGRTVALKVLQPALDADPAAPERFRLEARTLSALDHPNICTVHEIGETDDGRLFLAMPLYDGETLALRIARGAVPVADALPIAVQVARALANVHARGIIHRDIKPSNVLITGDGTVKLLDFGIAKLAGVSLTGAAAPPGTMSYMSPEHLAGKDVDQRTDIWSLGVVLYEMLAGRHPFRREGMARADVVRAIRGAKIARIGVGEGTERILEKAMARERRNRYASAGEMGREMEEGLGG